ncbi:hypothetical protein GCM10022258_21210 [Aquimarina gracilis]
MVLGTLSLTAQNMDQSSLVYIDGDMIQFEDNNQELLEESTMLLDCSTLFPDGSFKTADGLQFRLKDGECLDMYGIRYRNEYQYRYKMKKENKDLTPVQLQNRYQDKVHYIKLNGDVFKIKNRYQKRIRKPVTLKNNTIVDPFGTYKTPGQEEIRFKDGECLNSSGVKFEGISEYRKVLAKKSKTQQKTKKSTAL